MEHLLHDMSLCHHIYIESLEFQSFLSFSSCGYAVAPISSYNQFCTKIER